MDWKDVDPDFQRLRSKLFRSGQFSQTEISQIFETLSSPDDLTNFKLIAQKCQELVLMPEYAEYRGLIDEICRFMVANEGQEIAKITATKKNGKWLFVVS